MKQYTLWRRFLAWFGFVCLFTVPFVAATLWHLYSLINQCINLK